METTTFIELHNSQDFSNITPAEALTIMQDHLDTYQEGERFLRRFQSTRNTLEAIYGKKINKRKVNTINKVKTSQNGSETTTTTTPSKPKKYRYIMTDIEKEISHLSFVAKAIYNNILITHDSNAIGIFQYDLGTKAGYLGIPVETLIKGLQELQETGYARYKDGYIYHNHFIQQQKSSGNDDNKRGAVKIYNALPANVKLPYINSLDLTTATAKQVNEMYERLSKAIPTIGLLLSNIPLTNDFKNELKEAFGEDSENLINNGYTSLMDTLQVEDFRKNITKTEIEIPVIYDEEIVLDELKEVSQQEEILQPKPVITPVTQQQEDIQPTLSKDDMFAKILNDVATGNFEKPQLPKKMTDEEIEDFVLNELIFPEEKKEGVKKIMKSYEFNNLYHLVRNGSRNKTKIKEYFDNAITHWGQNQNKKSA